MKMKPQRVRLDNGRIGTMVKTGMHGDCRYYVVLPDDVNERPWVVFNGEFSDESELVPGIENE